jgi:glycosyltransferase involved in cell wall biosynthesis
VREVVFVDVSSQMSGVEFSTLYVAQQLDRASWLPLVVCAEEGDLPARCRAADVAVALVPHARFFSTGARLGKRIILNPFAVLYNIAVLVAAARPLARFLRERRSALVVTKGLLAHFYGGLAARWAGVPCVWHVQDRVSERAGQLLPWVLSAAGRVLAREIIADADSIARQLRTFVLSNRISVIWNGVDLDEFSPQNDGTSVRKEWGVCEEDLLIGSIARLTPWKGQNVLIEAFARIADQFPKAHLVFVGSALFDTDAYARRLKSDVVRLGIEDRVIFAGFRSDIPQVLAALDLVAHTSLEKDSSPLAVVSAMAAGKPIVCSNVDGTAELFKDGVDGLLVPSGYVDGLAERLGCLLSNAKLRTKLGNAAREKAERKLSVERFARECEAVFDRALGVRGLARQARVHISGCKN